MTRDLHRTVVIEELPPTVKPYDLVQLYRDQPYLTLLESPAAPSKLARYSFLCSEPFLVFKSKRKEAWAGPPGKLEKLPGDPFTELAALLKRYGGGERAWVPGLPPFLGGAVGYLGYELLYLLEDIPDLGRDDLALPDAYFIFCDTVFSSDSHDNKSWVSTTGFGLTTADAERAAGTRMTAAKARVAQLSRVTPVSRGEDLRARRREILVGRPRLTEKHVKEMGIVPVIEHQPYLDVVRAAKEHIFAGDCFEVCTVNRFDTQSTLSGGELYRVLSTVSEAPFASYLRFPETEVVSSSPERFLRLDRDRWADTRPIKGTRPRGRTPQEDEFYYNDLGNCEKDQAENIMIVDLARNDLGRVCDFETVTVPELRIIETYPFTHQLVSTVRGRLRPELGAMDVIRATFPGGSMTGAPKVEAMKIIDALEPVKRGIYSGSIGYFDFEGAFDLNIVIRTLIKKSERLTFHVGGAIVADSDPEEEYQETLDKAHGMVTALEIAKEARGQNR
ncbi:MAG: pabB [Myxococcaceae bacterium]|nr:pabB [Myxococcaceae bacterium]